ncbi:MAG: hypothetical protein L6407_09445, partial [Candidatus Delongbacteria bacterium]|nr:hypothetical protein [Candidatus Delongbacteria bacterium]
MKKLIIFLFIILSMLILIGAGGNVEDAAVHKIARADWIVVQCGGDSTLFRGSVDTLLMYPDSLNLAMRESLLTKLDSTGIYYHAEIADSAGALTDSLKVTLTDAKAYTDVRETAITTAYETMVSDSAQALTDSLKVNLSDSKAYALARIADSLAAVTKLTFLNGLTITNPDSGVITDATGIKLVGDVRVTGSVTGTSMGLTSHLYLPLENDASTPTLNFGDDADGIYSSADGKVNIATNGALRAEFSDTGLEFTDQGSSVNSLKIAMVADNTGTKQTGEMNVNYGVNPYIRMSPPNSAGTATPTMDMRSDLISWFNGEDGIDYYVISNGYDNDGTITYMEDEDRFDFDNDISAGGDITATDYIVGSTSLFTTISDSTQFALDSAKAYTDVREVAITTAYGTMISDSTQALTDSLKVTLTDAKAYTDVRETAINLAMIDSAKAVWDDSTHATEIVFPNALSIRMSSVSVTNPSSSSIAINATTATITADSTRIQNVGKIDILKTDEIVITKSSTTTPTIQFENRNVNVASYVNLEALGGYGDLGWDGSSSLGKVRFVKDNIWTTSSTTHNSHISFVTKNAGVEVESTIISKEGKLEASFAHMTVDSVATNYLKSAFGKIETNATHYIGMGEVYGGTGFEICDVDGNSGIEFWGQGSSDYNFPSLLIIV